MRDCGLRVARTSRFGEEWRLLGLEGSAEGHFVVEGGRVVGLATSKGHLRAPLVIDASGRAVVFARRQRRTLGVTEMNELMREAQADAYARLFAIFVKHKDHIARVTFWGLSDRRSWRRTPMSS